MLAQIPPQQITNIAVVINDENMGRITHQAVPVFPKII
jgi:hypothetical protein